MHTLPRNPLPLILLSALLAIGGCAVNPVTGKKELTLISTEKEVAMGNEHYLSSQQAEGGLYTVDAELTRYVASVGQRVAAVSDRPLPYEFVVLNNSAPNAWALPGGKIAVNRGLLLELDNEAELAAVLGHEIVHAAARHGARQMQRGVLFQAVLLGATIAAEGSDNANYIVGGAGLALQLTNFKYGRSAESESDYFGMKYMRAAGYDTATAVTLQQKFVALSEGRKSNWLEGLFSSHPPSTERTNKNRESLADFPAGGEVGRERYQQRLAYLRARQDSYKQADRARQLIEKDPRTALNAINTAIQGEPREPLFYGIKGQILAHQRRYNEAAREYDTAIARDPNYYGHFLGRGAAYNNLGQRNRAHADLERSYKLLPTAAASYQLGSLALAGGNRATAKRFYNTAGKAGGTVGEAARTAFIKLDLADAPQRYVTAEPFLKDGQILLRVKNTTSHVLKNIVIRIDANINGQLTSRNLPLTRLPANITTLIPAGIRYLAQNPVEAQAQVIRATPAG